MIEECVFCKIRKGEIPSTTLYKDDDFMEQYGQKVHDCSGLIKGYLFCETPDGFYKTYSAEIDGGIDLNHCSEKGDISTMPDMKGVLVFYPRTCGGLYW